jgi:hypothetical protein
VVQWKITGRDGFFNALVHQWPVRPQVRTSRYYFMGMKCITNAVVAGVVAGLGFLAFAGAQEKKEAPLETAAGIPIAKIKESIIACPLQQITLDGWASIDVGGEVVEWDWDVNGDRKADTVVHERGDLVMSVPRKTCTFSVYLWVKDNKGNKSEPDSCTVHVQAGVPRVSMGADTTIPIAARLNLDPHVEFFCTTPLEYQWDFNDDGKPEYKSEETGKTSRIYFKPGKFHARLTVVDNLGNEVGGIKTITVIGKR